MKPVRPCRTSLASSKQHSALFGQGEMSEHIRPVRTVTENGVDLTPFEGNSVAICLNLVCKRL